MIFSLIVDISKNKKEENNVPVETVYVIDWLEVGVFMCLRAKK